MTLSIAHLGPPGTYAEQAAFFYLNWLKNHQGIEAGLQPYPTIAQSLQAVANQKADLAVVPVENSIEGGVSMTVDTLWQLDNLRIQLALVLPITHNLISCATSLKSIQTVYSHPQGLAQCQKWLGEFLPNVNLIPANSTAEALQLLAQDDTIGAIASSRAANLYDLPILATGINDYPENCTRFWVITQGDNPDIPHLFLDNPRRTSLAFSVAANIPGALVQPLQVFAQQGINLSRIESRPTKRSLGEYLFFIDLEADADAPVMQTALTELNNFTEILKIFGSYNILSIPG
ncbi:prephenate dehydratase [Richelia sinica FACHB-800]|uniref:Prephenate dehydratase n=1 Tax=Richelia sinica FACHB-800 TaxID=1357546 RepID=A0A975TCQ8_9NOST|nr:prephenate dehydratase [Richelia sinica]MBD2663878.1 prephenate dehydratase [Richelia sinica FACHB-800]QXE26403.1 prephenate dehydratase [Richelia sinica FACHB-800]